MLSDTVFKYIPNFFHLEYIPVLFLENTYSMILQPLKRLAHSLMRVFFIKLELLILITYFSTVVPLASYVFFPVGLSLLTRQFQQVF